MTHCFTVVSVGMSPFPFVLFVFSVLHKKYVNTDNRVVKTEGGVGWARRGQ